MSEQLYGAELGGADEAYPMLIRKLVPPGLRGFMFAAIAGAVMSSLASMLNSASTIFTMDLYKQHLNPKASQKTLVVMGRIMTVLFVIIGCLIAPHLTKFGKGVFSYIQEFQGFISPGILAAFVFGMIFKHAPPRAGIVALLLNPIIYGFLLVCYGEYAIFETWGLSLGTIAFLNRMAITFAVIILVMGILTLFQPMSQPKVMPLRQDFDMKPAKSVVALGAVVIFAVILFYIVFW